MQDRGKKEKVDNLMIMPKYDILAISSATRLCDCQTSPLSLSTFQYPQYAHRRESRIRERTVTVRRELHKKSIESPSPLDGSPERIILSPSSCPAWTYIQRLPIRLIYQSTHYPIAPIYVYSVRLVSVHRKSRNGSLYHHGLSPDPNVMEAFKPVQKAL